MKPIVTSLLVLFLTSGVRAEEKFELTANEKAVLEATNAERAKEKLSPFLLNPRLFQAARDHSKNMAKQGKLQHVLDGKGPPDRAKDAGYKNAYVGENCAAGRKPFPPKEAMVGWMESPGHRGNILSKQYNEMGIGIARSANGTVYYTQVFGRTLKR